MTESFDTYVKTGILANNQYGITEVNELSRLAAGYFHQEKYAEIESLIQKGNTESLNEIVQNQSKASEFLELMTFKDQQGKKYIVSVYDSLELIQDPQVIEMYSLDKQ